MAQYQPPNPPPNLYNRHDAKFSIPSAIGAFLVVTFIFGLVLGFVISVASGPLPLGEDRLQRELARFSIGFYIAAPFGLWVAAAEVVPALRVREQIRAEFAAQHRAAWEAEQRRNQAHQAYTEAYSAYLPKWQAWRGAMQVYEAELAAYQAWRERFTAAWDAYRERAKRAVSLFDTIYASVQTRGRVELELSEPEHLDALFREAFAEVAKSNPDLGILGLVCSEARWKVESPPKGPLTPQELKKITNHFTAPEGVIIKQHEIDKAKSYLESMLINQVNATIEFNLPELLYLHEDERLERIRDLLPPVPSIEQAGIENRTPPTKPERPAAPGNVIFSSQPVGGYYPPVPPERVTWS